MHLVKPTKTSSLVMLCIVVLGTVLWGIRSAGAQQTAVITIDGQTTCTDQGVTAIIEVVNPAPGFVVYFDVWLGDEVQYSEELATGQRESFVFTLPRQDFPATVSEGVMSAFSSDLDDEGESLPVAYRWPAVLCGSTSTTTTVIEEVPTSVADIATESTTTSSTSTSTTTTVSTTTVPETDEVGIGVSATEERAAPDALASEQATSSTDMLAYTGVSTGQIALAIIALGAVLLGAGCIITRPRPLRR